MPLLFWIDSTQSPPNYAVIGGIAGVAAVFLVALVLVVLRRRKAPAQNALATSFVKDDDIHLGAKNPAYDVDKWARLAVLPVVERWFWEVVGSS